MPRHFTSPLYPGVPAPQNPADWPELQASVIEKFNKWYDPEVQQEIARRNVVPADGSEAPSMAYQDEIYFAHMEAWARMELVRHARLHRGEHVSVSLPGFAGGMKLEKEDAKQ